MFVYRIVVRWNHISSSKINHRPLIYREWDLQVELGRKPKIVLGDKYREDNHYQFDD